MGASLRNLQVGLKLGGHASVWCTIQLSYKNNELQMLLMSAPCRIWGLLSVGSPLQGTEQRLFFAALLRSFIMCVRNTEDSILLNTTLHGSILLYAPTLFTLKRHLQDYKAHVFGVLREMRFSCCFGNICSVRLTPKHFYMRLVVLLENLYSNK